MPVLPQKEGRWHLCNICIKLIVIRFEITYTSRYTIYILIYVGIDCYAIKEEYMKNYSRVLS